MPKHLQVRDVPDHIHRKLKARAALEGKSLSDYLLGEIKVLVGRPTMEELFAELESLEPVDIGDAAELIREGREERARQLDEAIGDLSETPKARSRRKRNRR